MHLPRDLRVAPGMNMRAYLKGLTVEHAWAMLQMVMVIPPYGAATGLKVFVSNM